jgi:hypothetical protein
MRGYLFEPGIFVKTARLYLLAEKLGELQFGYSKKTRKYCSRIHEDRMTDHAGRSQGRLGASD